jgi:hypothetical protein
MGCRCFNGEEAHEGNSHADKEGDPVIKPGSRVAVVEFEGKFGTDQTLSHLIQRFAWAAMFCHIKLLPTG